MEILHTRNIAHIVHIPLTHPTVREVADMNHMFLMNHTSLINLEAENITMGQHLEVQRYPLMVEEQLRVG